MAKNNVIHQWYLPSYPSIDWTTAAVNIKRPRPSALFYYSICKTGQLTSFATLPYQQANRYAVVGDIAIRFLSNLAQKASLLIPNSRSYRAAPNSKWHITNPCIRHSELRKVLFEITNNHNSTCTYQWHRANNHNAVDGINRLFLHHHLIQNIGILSRTLIFWKSADKL